jgi:RNA polymerase sigma-70 factor (ECF subfamily)
VISRDDPDQVLQQACRVYRIAWNMLGSAAEAEQATGQTLLLFNRFPDRDGISLYSIALDVVLLRTGPTRRSGAESLDFFLPRFDAQGCLASPPLDWSDLTGEALRRPDLADAIRGMLQRLDPMDRAAFILREIEQVPLEETAGVLRVSAADVRGRTHRAALLLDGMLASQIAAFYEPPV